MDLNRSSPSVNIDVSNADLISTPSTSPEPVEAKENESPSLPNVTLSNGPPKITLPTSQKANYELCTENFINSSPLLHHKSNFPISSLISTRACNNSDFINSSAFISSIRHPFYLANQGGVSLFDRNPFFREISMSPHFVPPFNSIKNSLFSAFNTNDKYDQ